MSVLREAASSTLKLKKKLLFIILWTENTSLIKTVTLKQGYESLRTLFIRI